jgi:ABC-type sugar transport system substrate-binding protein
MLTMRRALQLLLAALAMGVAMEAFSRQKKWCIEIWQGEGGDVFMMSMDYSVRNCMDKLTNQQEQKKEPEEGSDR